MAASKKNTKGNKTAHVLNLLAPNAAKEGSPTGEEGSADGSVEQTTSVSPSHPLLPPILEVAQSNDDNLAQQIQQALEEELEENLPPAPAQTQPAQTVTEEVPPLATEVSTPDNDKMGEASVPSGGKMSQDEIEKLLASTNAPAQEPAPVPAPEPPAPSGGKMSQDEIEKLLASTNAPAQEPAPAPAPEPPAPSGGKMSQDEIEKLLAASAPAQEPAPAPAPEPPPPSGGKMSQDEIEKLLAAANAPVQEPAPAPESSTPAQKPVQSQEDEDISYMNIMQVLVEEKAPSYIKKFGLCTCKHCEADVKALTLSNLVPKYVVLSKLDRIPMLTVYEGRFNSTIFAQLTRACKIVMDHPHHDRSDL